MICRSNAFIIFTLLLLSSLPSRAQLRPIGNWRSHLPTNRAQGIATDGQVNYVITMKGYYTYKIDDGYTEQFSKVDGLHDTNPIALGYDDGTKTAIICYENGNIDIIKDYNYKLLPDLKNKSFPGDKSIREIFTEDGFSYISTGLGLMVIDLAKKEVKETYVFSKGGQTMGVNSFTADQQYYYAALDKGLYRISKTSSAPQVFANWQPLDTGRSYKKLALLQQSLFASTSGITDSLYKINPDGTRNLVWRRDSTNIIQLTGIDSVLYAGTFNVFTGIGKYHHLLQGNLLVDSTAVGYPRGIVKDNSGHLWFADQYQGMGKRQENKHGDFYVPSGPSNDASYDLYARGGEVWVAHGGVYPRSYESMRNRNGISHFKAKDDKWEWLMPATYGLFADSVTDFMEIEKDPYSGTLYAGTRDGGIFELSAEGQGRMLKQGALLPDGRGGYPATGLAVDLNGNLWVNQYGVTNELALRTKESTWYHFFVPPMNRALAPNGGARMIVDDANQKWYQGPFGGGVIVYNDGGTPEDPTDDDYRNLFEGKGYGNLPSGNVLCLAKDRDGAIWIGTDKGIAIMSNPSQAVTDKQSDAELRVVQYDQFAGVLFSNESVSAIAVDGANRKWIGTSNGVWLLSPDANKIVSRFTVDNSPLPSNSIQSIAVDGLTGDVYFGTSDGLISYRGTAVEGSESAGSIKTFPNPVPSGYSGAVTLQGFTTDADVRITDIAGQLIYRARATGGQVVWNGLDYTGHRPQTGVLLIFASSKDGSKTAVGKMILMH